MTSNGSWQKVRLGNLAQNVTINEYEPLENNLTKYVAGDHLESKKLHITRFGDLKTDKEVIGSAFHRRFSSGDILFGSRRAYLRKTGIATFDGLCSNTTLAIRKKSDELVDGILPFIFRLGKFTEYAVERSTGSVTPYVLWRNLADFTFDLPPKSEQLKIKEFLWTLQTSIDNLETVLEKTKNYMISKRESLLTRGIGHKKLKKVQWLYGKTIEIPEEWQLSKLRNFATIHGRIGWKNLRSNEYLESGFLMLSVWSLVETSPYGINFTEGVKRLSKFRYEESPEIQLRNNDVLVAKDGDIGRIGFIKKLPEPTTVNSHVVPVRVNNEALNSEFLYWFFKSNLFQNYCKSYTTGTTVPLLTQEDLRNSLILIPKNKNEQQKIISILSNIDKQITQQQSHLNNLYTLQDSVLNSKLTKEKNVTN